jgi:hypothetical protein
MLHPFLQNLSIISEGTNICKEQPFLFLPAKLRITLQKKPPLPQLLIPEVVEYGEWLLLKVSTGICCPAGRHDDEIQ